MDITFKTSEGVFNYRVCGIIIHDNKILAMHDDRSPYYYLPGGRVQLNETVEEAVLREIKEELSVDARIVRPLWLNQGFFTEDVSKQKYHEVCLYFLMDISDTDILSRGNSFISTEGNRKHVFEWLSFDQLENEYFYPIFLKEKIYSLPDTLTVIASYD